MTLEESAIYGNIIEVYEELYRTLDNHPEIAGKIEWLKDDINLLKQCADEVFRGGPWHAITQGF